MAKANQTLIENKARLRKEILAIRNHLDQATRALKDRSILMSLQNLAEIQSSDHVFCYISQGSEPDTHNLIEWLVAAGKRVSVPKIIRHRQILAIEFPGWKNLHPGEYGILEPASDIDVSSEVDISLTPGVAFDDNGNRLGNGTGYYDRWLAAYPVRHTISPAYDCQVLDLIPVNELDKKVGLIVTESRVIRP
jgi:5-formyltetrahydrofolate cyclo-ligase